MSIYKRPALYFNEENEIIFNGNDLIVDDNVVSSEDLSKELTNYVPSSGGVIEGDVILRSGNFVIDSGSQLTFSDGGSQNTALTSDRVAVLNDAGESVTNIYFDAATSKTTITDNFELTGTLIIPDNFISISKITNLQNNLDTHTNDIATNTTKLTNVSYAVNQTLVSGELQCEDFSCDSFLNNGPMHISNQFYEITDQKFNWLSTVSEPLSDTFTAQMTKNNAVDSSLNMLSTFRDTQLTKNSEYDASFNQLQTFRTYQLLSNTIYDGSFNSLSTFQSEQLTKNGIYDASLNILGTFKNNQITTNGIYDISFNSLSTFQSEQLTKNGIYDASLNQLQTFKSEQLVSNSIYDGSFNSLSTFQSEQQTKNGLYDVSLNVLHIFKEDQQDTNSGVSLSISELNTFKSNQLTKNIEYDASLNQLQTFRTEQGSTNISFNNTINSIVNQLNFKQATINSSNKIASSYISTAINETLADKLVEIDNTLLAVDASFSAVDASLNSLISLTNSITNVEVLQNLLEDLNNNDISDLLESRATVSYVNTELANKVDITAYDNFVVSVNTSITTINETKQNLIDASNNMLEGGYVKTGVPNKNLITSLSEINTSITTLTNTKQPLIDASHLLDASFVSIGLDGNSDAILLTTALATMDTIIDAKSDTSYVNTQLELKQDAISLTNLLDASFVSVNSETNLINKLQTIDDSISTVSQDLSNGLALKQATINGENLLSSQYVSVPNGITLQSYINTNNTNISDINTALNSKQSTINNENKLSSIYISTNVNSTASDLHTELNAQYSAIQNAVNEISTINNTTIPAVEQSISDLDLAKQDTINSQNLLSSNYVQAGTDVSSNPILLTSKLDAVDVSLNSLATDIATKQSTISTLSRLESDKVSTYVNNSNGVLSNILQGLTDVNTNQSTAISTNSNDIITERGRIDGLSTRVTVSETNVGLLQGADVQHEQRMDGIDSDISALESNKQDVISSSNKISSAYISTNVKTVSSTLDVVLESIDDDLTALDNNLATKQDLLNNTTNKLPYTHINFTGSNWSNLDYTASISSKFLSLDNQISTLTGLQQGDVTSFQEINQDLTDIDNAIVGLGTSKQNVIDINNKLDGNFVKYNNSLTIIEKIDSINSGGGSSIPSISYDSNLLETTISDRTIIGTDIKFADNSVQTTAFTSAKNTDLSTCKLKLTDISYNSLTNTTTVSNTLIANGLQSTVIDDINTALSGKQSTLNGTTNKLNASYIDFSSSNIQYADFGSSISAKITSIDGAIQTLNSNDSEQININTTLANDISALSSSKQNVLSLDNKLNSAFLACSGLGEMSNTKMQYLSSISGDIQEQLSLKADSSALSGKWDTPSNETNLSYVDITSSLTNLLSGKWSTPSNASNLANVDISSSLTTLLSGKWNTPSNESSLSHVDISSSLTNLLSGKWSTPSNASNLANVDISSSLTTLLSGKWDTPSNASNLANVDISSSLTTLLSGKWNTPSNESSLSHVDISSSLTTLLSGKWSTPSNASNLANVDISSSLTGLLDSKANINGNTYTGTHNFSGATLLGVSAGTIADGDLTIAKTSGLQEALDSKMNFGFNIIHTTLTTATSVFSLADSGKHFVLQSQSAQARSLILPANPPNGTRYYINLNPTGTTAWNASIYYADGTTLISNGAFSSGVSICGVAVNLYYSTGFSRWIRF